MSAQFHVMLDSKPIGKGIANLLAIPAAVMSAVSSGDPALQVFNIGMLTIVVIVLWAALRQASLKYCRAH
ncbi:MAG: hypothetical protein HOP23_10410 [Methylococcaceae bacterium]|nr:hypothetical protein [Methylococcaceae bacterium]